MSTSLPYLGGHVSAAGGLSKALENGEKIGAEAIQLFGASPRQWFARTPHPAEIAEFIKRRGESPVKRIYLHGAYLVNLASPSEELRLKSEKNLLEHFMIASSIAADGLIFHIGSGREMPKYQAIGFAGDAMRRILDRVPGACDLIIENTAGGGQKLGSNPDEVARVMDRISSPRVKVCFDTQHAFAGGTIEHFTPEEIRHVFKGWDDAVGLELMTALHINDSKTKFNSRHDRHENLGQGYIGLEGFRNLAAFKALHDKAWLLEVPGFLGQGPDEENMKLLRGCFR